MSVNTNLSFDRLELLKCIALDIICPPYNFLAKCEGAHYSEKWFNMENLMYKLHIAWRKSLIELKILYFSLNKAI